MLSFIYGAAGCGKSDEIYRRAAMDAENGRHAFILVPEQYSMYTEHELLTRMGLAAQNRIQVLTFSRLCNMIFAKLGPLRMKYIDKAGKYMTAYKALQKSEKQLTLLRPNVHQHGFAAIAASTVSEFKRYGVSPERLCEAADKTDDERLKMKLRDLSVIYRSYNEITTDENYSDSEDNLSLIIPKIAECDFLSGIFYINFFRSFTPTEYGVIAELMKKADICAVLCTDTLADGPVVFSSQIHTRKKLLAIANDLDVSVEKPILMDKTSENRFTPELLHIRNNFFAPRPAPMHGIPKSVHICRPNNYYSEVTECAKLIVRLCRTENRSLNDFLILTGGMENYEQLIPPIFAEFGIKYFLDKKTCLTESPFMRMMISILEILAYGFSYERVMAIARSGYFDISADMTDMFENYVLAADIGHKHWNMREKWTYNPDERIFSMETVNAAKALLLHPILDLADMFKGRKTVAQICMNLYDWLNSIGMPDTVSQKLDAFTAEAQPELAEQLRLVWNSFVSVTNQMSECMGAEPTTFAEFYGLFVSACGELTVGMIPPTQDKVIISEPDRFRSTGTKIVIVLGVCDRIFPRGYTSEGIITDAERIMLANSGLELAPDAYSRQKEEQFLIYSVLTTASEQLYLFAPVSDRDGKSLEVSEIIQKLRQKLFPDITVEGGDFSLRIPEGREYIFNELTSRLFECGWRVDSLPTIWHTAFEHFNNVEKYKLRLEKMNKMNSNKSAMLRLDKKTAKLLYGEPLVLSVSKLEKYNSCAFSFFMQYGLLARERMTGGFKANDMGTVLHDVLCKYFQQKSAQDADYGSITREDCSAEISALVDETAYNGGEALYADSCYCKYLALRMKSIASATAWKMIRFYAQSNFRPCGFEISFGRHGAMPPYKISSENGDVFLEGFIDRADSMTADGVNYICITDYKSSEKKLDTALAEAGIRFQPLIYANALCSSINNSQPAAMLYLHMNDPILRFDSVPTEFELEKGMNDAIKTRGIILDNPDVIYGIDADYGNKTAIHYISCDSKSVIGREEMVRRLSAAEEKASQSADCIAEGIIDINPISLSDFDSCTYCPYQSVCDDGSGK